MKSWRELEVGGCITEPGNSLKNFTGSSRKGHRPEFSQDSCINCFFCWVFCPENAIIVEDDKITGINYDFCKGCGICAAECPVKTNALPLVMKEEAVEL